MLKKIELRKKLKEISLVNADYSQMVIDRLQNIIKDKIVCTYIPLQNEVNIEVDSIARYAVNAAESYIKEREDE